LLAPEAEGWTSFCALFQDTFNVIGGAYRIFAMTRWMKAWFGSFLIFVLVPSAVFAGDTDYSNVPTAALIDELAGLDRPAPGIAGTGWYEPFLAEDKPRSLPWIMLGAPVPPPEAPPAMRELVRRGVDALPVLIQHLYDARPTKLVVGKDGPGVLFRIKLFAREYDARKPLPHNDAGLKDKHYISSDYTVKIADVCYVLIGQIVNRRLVAVRQLTAPQKVGSPATGILLVNSPIEEPSLITQVKSDWEGLDIRNHEESLVSDIMAQEGTSDTWAGPNLFRADAALRRLRYYYPERYAVLNGQELRERQEFEAKEAGYDYQAHAYKDKGEHAKAAEEWTKWIKVAPQSKLGYRMRGYEFAKSGRLDEAISDYSRALELEPKSYLLEAILRERASAYHAKGAEEQAMADYNELIRITPRNDARLASFLDSEGQHELAIELYNQAFALNPNSDSAAFYESRGIAYQRLGDTAKALEDFNKALELNPKDWRSYNNRAWTLMTAGRLDEALADVTKAISLRPKSTMIMDTRAHILLAMNRTQDAIADFNAVIQSEKKSDPSTFCGRGTAYERVGSVDLAIADFKRCLELRPVDQIDRQAQEQAKVKLKALTTPPSESASPPR
jgi:tetratricopeptide (TPR) repeat protein